MWETKTVQLGDILEKSIHKVKFKLLEKLEIVEMLATCGCTKPVFNKKTNTVEVTFKAGRVPKHLRYKGSFVVKKEIKVFTPQGRHTLEIKAIIKMKYFYDR